MSSSALDSTPFAKGTLVGGKYKVERYIAEGGIGVVVAARHVELDQHVAIKFLKPKARTNADIVARFQREAQLTAQMKSEHVVRVHDVGSTHAGGSYIVMELLTGKDLRAVIERGPVPIARAVDWVLQACDALAEAHAMRIVHRDIKPENLFLAERSGEAPCVKIIDFGISKMPQKEQRNGHWARETGTNERFGTPFYMSPEQLQSSTAVDARSDIWSLGAVLFELLTGATPFDGEDMARLCTSILTGQPKKLLVMRATAPAGLGEVIAKCLEKRADLRFRNVGELAQALLPYGPPDTTSKRVERICEAISRAGGSIRPPTPAAPMNVQSLLELLPPVLPVPDAAMNGYGTMDSVVLPERRPSRKARWAMVIGLAVLATGIITARVRSVPAATTVHASVVEPVVPRASAPTETRPPELVASSPSPTPTTTSTSTSNATRAKKSTPPAASVVTRAAPKPAPSANPRSLFGERQ